MISMLLLASLTLMGLSTGDDMNTAASDGVTSVEPTYTLYWPSNTPTFSPNETISFTWSATGVSNAYYACHSSVAMDAEAERREWLNSSNYPLSKCKCEIYSSISLECVLQANRPYSRLYLRRFNSM